MFNFIKEKLQKIYISVTSHLQSIFNQSSIDQTTIDQLRELLLKADAGVLTTKLLLEKIEQAYRHGSMQTGAQLQSLVHQELKKIIDKPSIAPSACVFLLVGINGSGKTTCAGKLAYQYILQGKSVIVAAADTFRAAAPEQLQRWTNQVGAQLILGKPNQDPAAITFDACETFKKNKSDILIVDTAGRLQNKDHLMKELEKIKRILTKQLPNYTICTLLTVDAMLGQNSFSQAQLFNESTKIDGIILTKLDGTAKGGIVFSIVQTLGIPISFLSWGEQAQDMTSFDAEQYVQNLLGITTFQNSKQKQQHS